MNRLLGVLDIRHRDHRRIGKTVGGSLVRRVPSWCGSLAAGARRAVVSRLGAGGRAAAGAARAGGYRFASVLALALLGACSPDWNWRDVHPEGGDLRVMLPARPAQMTRAIRLDGVPLSMTMHGAKVGGTAFTVAWVDLAQDRADLRERVLAAMSAGMVGNIGAPAEGVRRTTARIAVVDRVGQPAGTLELQRVDAKGRAGDRAVELHAGFAARGARAWQFVVVGEAVPPEHLATFFESLRLVVR